MVIIIYYMEAKIEISSEDRTSASSGLKCIDEENTNYSKRNSLILDIDENIGESLADSTCEGDEPIFIQKVPQMKIAPGTHRISKSLNSSNFLLLMSLEAGDISESIRIITKSQPKPDANFKWDNDNTFLHIAADKGYLKTCEVLLDYIEDIHLNSRNKKLMQPLHLAAKNGFFQIVQLLIRSGADLNSIDNYGNTPLHYAGKGGHKKIVLWLISKGAYSNIKNKEDQTVEDVSSDEIKLLIKRYNRKKTVTYSVPMFSNSAKLSEIRAQKILSEENLYNFSILSQLGKGSFGEVFLVRNQINSKLYAMKVIDKERMAGKNLIFYAMTERNVLSQIKHPFIVSLNMAFQTSEKLFLILDYCSGGDLSVQLQREKRFSESRARLYLCEIILALEELHCNDVIFRDLKPDNIVIDEDGHVKLTDFGLSKEGIDEYNLTNSFCGSIGYLAPEVLKRNGYGKSVDWYLLGALFYEMVIGLPPYFTNDRNEWLANIEKGKLRIPSSLSLEAKELIKDVRFI